MTGPAGPDHPPFAGVDLVLFDLDGTITDSQSGIAASLRHTLDQFGLTADDEAIRACLGPPLPTSLIALGVPADLLDGAIAIYRAWFAAHGIFDNQVYPGVVDMLDRVRDAGLPTGLATAKLRRFAVDILDHFALAGYFDPVAGTTGDGRLNNKTEVVADALIEAGVAGSDRVLMVGDRDHDMFGAAANGVTSIGVTYGYGTRSELEAGGATWIVDSPAEVADLILTLATPAGSPGGSVGR